MEFNDYKILNEKFNDVVTIQDILKNNLTYSYNQIQFMMEATSNRHLTVSGGNATISSYFGGDVLIYTHPKCGNATRGMWYTNSWLSKVSGANIYGFQNFDDLIDKATELWVK